MTSKIEMDFIVGAVVGTVIGLMAALVFTPFSGKSMRNRIAHEFDFSSNGQKEHVQARRRSNHAAAAAKVKTTYAKKINAKNHK